MELDDILEFIKAEHTRVVSHYNMIDDPKTKYTMLAKLTEEVGELAEAILSYDSLQRGPKLRHDKSKLEHEVADVILTTLMISREMNIDVKKALSEKVKKIKKRRYK
jgi:NTP pyrophosphatase (non-canonical NTP hydrolase)